MTTMETLLVQIFAGQEACGVFSLLSGAGIRVLDSILLVLYPPQGMTTLEHLFMQIFDRKAWIESQLRQQSESYGESLAYNLLADGGQPPPWLWETASDAPGCSGQEVLSREELIQRILFPLPRATTPSTNHNNTYSVPAFKSANINKCNSFVSETCISNERIHSENIDIARTINHKDDRIDSDMVCFEVVEDSPVLDLCANTQCCRSKQRDTENHFNRKFQASKFGDRTIEHACRITRSMASSFMPDHVKEPPVSKNSFDLHRKSGDGAAPSRSLDCFDNTLKPLIPSGFISNKATASQKSDDLTVNTHNISVRECCISAVGQEFVSNGSNFVDPGLVTTVSSASRLFQNQSLVVTKKLSFDGIDICCLDENTHAPFPQKQTENLFRCSEGELEKLNSVQSLKEHPILKDTKHGSGAVHLEKDVLHTEAVQSAEVAASSSTEKERIESQCERYEKLILMSKEAKNLSLSNGMSNSSPPSMLRSSLNLSGNKKLHCSAQLGNTSGSLIERSKEQQSGEPTTSTQSIIAAARQTHTSSDVERMYLSNKIESCELNKDGAEKTMCSSFQFLKGEEFHMNSKNIFGSSRQKQLHQEEILPAMGSLEKVCTTHSCEKQSDRSMEHIMKDSCAGKLSKKSVCSLDQLTHSQCDNSVLLSDEVETECTEFVAVEIGSGVVAKPTITIHDDNGPASIEHRHSRSSAATSDVSGFNDSASHCPNDHQLVSLEKESLIDSLIRDVPAEILTAKLPNASEMLDNQTKLSCFLMSSTGSPENVGPSEENSENMKDENCENIMDGIEKSIVQPPSVGTHNHSSEARYFLRSLKRKDKTRTYSELNVNSNLTSSKESQKTTAEACEISWPKRRKLNCYSDSILATTPRTRIHRLHYQEDTLETSKRCSESVPLEEMQIPPSPSEFMLIRNIDIGNLDGHSEDHHQSQQNFEREDASCLKTKDQVMGLSLPIRSTNALPSPNLANGNSRTSLRNEICNNQFSVFTLEEPGTSGDDTDDKLTCTGAKGYCYGLQSTDKQEVCDSGKGLSTYDSSVLSNLKDDMVGTDEFMPELEGFSIGTSPTVDNDISCDSDCPTFREEQISLDVKQGISIDLLMAKVCPSGKYKINLLPDAYQPLPTGLLEHMNLNDSLNFSSDNIREFRASKHDKISDLCSSLGSASGLDSSFVERFYVPGTPASGARFGWRANKPPLTPPTGKSSLRNVSGKSGSSSQTLGTNPELVCFRIDETSCTVEDNKNSDKLGTSEEGICSKGIKIREPLQDVSSIYKNASTLAPLTKTILERGSLEFSYGAPTNVDSSLGSSYISNSDQIGDKENQYQSVNANKERKVVRSLNDRPSESQLSVQGAGRNSSLASTQKSCKTNNIISNVSSFLPMVRKKQQATTAKGKKDIKVKALEVAEAAKRLEEKKQIEREVRKAAAKLERERLEQEKQIKQRQLEEEKRRKEAYITARKRQREEEEKKEKERKRQEEAAAKLERERLEQEKQVKQKQLEEEKRRKEADIAARKRQREEEEKNVKERKKRRIEEAQKLQREQEGRLHAKKEEKELRLKAAVDDGKNKGIVQEAKLQLQSEREAVGSRKTDEVEPSATKVVINLDGMKQILQDRMSSSKEIEEFQSYDISPYKDSDDEDGEEENTRGMKQIPLWARRESLDIFLLSQKDLDPLEIFSCKRSFSLCEVLYPPVARRWPL